MSKKSYCVSIIVLTVVFLLSSAVFAADSSGIDAVFRKAKSGDGVINSGDKRVIGEFVSKSLDELVNALDLAEMSDIRNEIASRSIKKKPNQYSMAFAGAMKKALTPVLNQVANTTDEVRKNQLTINLLILLADINTIELAPIGMSMFGDENAAIRYWAVSSVATREIAVQLKSAVTGDPKLAAQIVSQFDKMVDENTFPEILNLIVTFADALDTTETDAILLRIASIRIKSYAQWTVKFEFMDANLLNSLARTIIAADSASKSNIAEIARSFAQLYSYAIQRYVRGFNILGDTQKNELVFVLAEVEQVSVGKLLGQSQNDIKKFVSSSNQRSIDSLDKEHDSLLGTASRAGRLARKLNFNYGKDAGVPIIAPKQLSSPKPLLGEE